jgi:hypothetical protein
MSPRNQKLSACMDGRLAAYATLAGVALAAPALAPTADASIVYSGAVNIAIPITTAGVYLNVQTGVNNPNPASVPGWDVNPYGSTSLILFNPAAPAGGVYEGAANAFNLALGTPVTAAGPYSAGTYNPTLNSTSNYVGFRFQNEAAGNQTQYGWFQMSFGTSATDPARAIIGYAYENTGLPINVGDTGVPEPTTTALLGVMAAGAFGVRAWRKRKAA